MPVSAGQTETLRPGVALDDGDGAPEPSGDVDEARVRRRARAPIRDPWSAGVRVLWRSIEGSGRGGGLPPATGGGLPIVRGSCSAGGACSPNGDSQRAGALGGATSGNGLPVQGVAFDAGRLITAGVEVGMGLDLTTHPGEALLSTRPGGRVRERFLAGRRAPGAHRRARTATRSGGPAHLPPSNRRPRELWWPASGHALCRYRGRHVAILRRVLRV